MIATFLIEDDQVHPYHSSRSHFKLYRLKERFRNFFACFHCHLIFIEVLFQDCQVIALVDCFMLVEDQKHFGSFFSSLRLRVIFIVKHSLADSFITAKAQ